MARGSPRSNKQFGNSGGGGGGKRGGSKGPRSNSGGSAGSRGGHQGKGHGDGPDWWRDKGKGRGAATATPSDRAPWLPPPLPPILADAPWHKQGVHQGKGSPPASPRPSQARVPSGAASSRGPNPIDQRMGHGRGVVTAAHRETRPSRAQREHDEIYRGFGDDPMIDADAPTGPQPTWSPKGKSYDGRGHPATASNLYMGPLPGGEQGAATALDPPLDEVVANATRDFVHQPQLVHGQSSQPPQGHPIPRTQQPPGSRKCYCGFWEFGGNGNWRCESAFCPKKELGGVPQSRRGLACSPPSSGRDERRRTLGSLPLPGFARPARGRPEGGWRQSLSQLSRQAQEYPPQGWQPQAPISQPISAPIPKPWWL